VTCPSCGTAHWRNPKPCANAIVLDGDLVLLTRRAHPDAPWTGMWCAPGGFCEVGEHPIETVEREVLEETGLAVAVTGYLGVWVDDYQDDVVIDVGYYTAVPLGEPEAEPDPREVSELRWFLRDELPLDLAPPGTLAEVLAVVDEAGPVLDRPTSARTPPG
jgi:ADP-ribose pyrophosphatase YjhB (NUDIX family)